MTRIDFTAIIVLAALALAAAACGQPLTTAEQTQTAQAVVTADVTTAVTPDTTATPNASLTPGATMTAPAFASPTPSPLAGLTDTGYKAADGSPLYKECIQTTPELPLPPKYPTPVGTIGYPPTPTVLNTGPTPDPAQLPPFDPAVMSPALTAGWPTYTSRCFGFSISYPPDWVVVNPFSVAGYQQSEDAVIRSADGTAKVEIHLLVSSMDQLRAAAAAGGRSDVYVLRQAAAATWKGKPAYEAYVFVYEQPPSVVLSRTVALGGWKYLNVSFQLTPPWNLQTAQVAAGVLESMVLP